MAINFLNKVDLNQNELDKARIVNEFNNTAAGPGVEGQLFFDTTEHALKIWANGAWTEVGATSGVETFTNTNVGSTYVDFSVVNASAIGDVSIGFADLNAIDGTSVEGTRFLSKDNTWDVISNIAKATATTLGTVKLFSDTVQTIAATAVSATAARTYGVQFNSSDQMVVNVPWTDTNVVTYTLTTTPGDTDPTLITDADINLIGSDSSTDTVTIAGSQREILISETGDTISVALASGAFTEWTTTGVNLKLPANTVAQTQTAGDNTTKIATTAFVQTATTGLLQLVGGFNASTGALASPLTGNLTSGATRVALFVGDYYVVTVDGDFFGNAATPLTVGDSVIVQTDAAVGTSVEADFIIVQSETDLASVSTVGIGNSKASTVIDKLGIDVAYTTPTDGTATIGVDINAQTDMPDALANTDQVLLYDASSGKNYKASIEKFSGHGSKRVSLNTSVTGISDQVSPPAGTQGWVIASNTVMGVGALDCSIEVMTDTAIPSPLVAGLTVYAEISRASNAITINFTAPSAIAQGEYQVIITRA
jgi:hypothetical protein